MNDELRHQVQHGRRGRNDPIGIGYRRVSRVATALLAAFWIPAGNALAAPADDYPNKPVRIIVPGPPAGTADIMGRMLARRLNETFSQNVVVDNRSGASGIIAAEIVVNAVPDGHTLFLGTAQVLAINPSIYKKLPYNAEKDFAPISLIAKVTQVLVVLASSPVRSVSDLIAAAKKRPRQMNSGSGGIGGASHLCDELFKTLAKIEVVHIAYKGQSLALSGLLGKELDYMFIGIPAAIGQVKGGRLRAIAVSTAERSAALPEVPTVAEAGVPGFEASAWYGALAAPRTPKAVINKLNTEVRQMLNTSATREMLLSQGASPAANSSEEFSEFISAEIKKWAVVVKASGAKAE